jgi:hypothetical protein
MGIGDRAAAVDALPTMRRCDRSQQHTGANQARYKSRLCSRELTFALEMVFGPVPIAAVPRAPIMRWRHVSDTPVHFARFNRFPCGHYQRLQRTFEILWRGFALPPGCDPGGGNFSVADTATSFSLRSSLPPSWWLPSRSSLPSSLSWPCRPLQKKLVQ